jgi:hypothetical protein
MRLKLSALSESQRAEAIAAFNARYGEMERVLWCLSRHCRAPLLEGHSSPAVEALIWTVKSWWGVQGVRADAKTLMSETLTTIDWSEYLFEERTQVPQDAETYAYELVVSLVERSRSAGVPRREFSLASKALHWLLPWRVPAYDSFVRQALGIPTDWDHPEAYRLVTREVIAAVREVTAKDPDWVGSLQPRSPLRAFDKCLWWFGGGNVGTAVEVRDPWRVVRRLGLEPC